MRIEGFGNELRPVVKHDRGEALMRALQFGIDNIYVNGLQHIEAVNKGPDEAVLMQGYILGLLVLCEDAIYWCETFGDDGCPAEINYTETLNALNGNKLELEQLNREMLAWVFHKAGLFDFEVQKNRNDLCLDDEDPGMRPSVTVKDHEQEGEK